MSIILASLGTEQITIESKNCELLGGSVTPYMREQLLDVLEDFAAKAAVNHGSLKIGQTLIETGILPAEGVSLKSDMRQAFIGAVQEKVESLLSSFMENGTAIDYSSLPGGGAKNHERPAPVRSKASDPTIIPVF